MSVITADRGGVLVPCSSCGKTNRLRYAALASANQCGSCRTRLEPHFRPVEVSDATTFDIAITSSALPVVVDFWAPWCGPCRMMAPELEKVAQGAAGEWLVVKVNTDAVPELGERYRIRSIPTLGIFHDGRLINSAAGARAADEIRAFVESQLPVRAS
jgi:thioredoxin 2